MSTRGNHPLPYTNLKSILNRKQRIQVILSFQKMFLVAEIRRILLSTLTILAQLAALIV